MIIPEFFPDTTNTSSLYDYQDYAERIKHIVHDSEQLYEQASTRFGKYTPELRACRSLARKAKDTRSTLEQSAVEDLSGLLSTNEIKDLFNNIVPVRYEFDSNGQVKRVEK